jgi:hypothetical protein
MSYQLQTLPHADALSIGDDELRQRIEDLLETQSQHFRKLWMYYRNPMQPRTVLRDEQGSDRPYRQAQEWGLPSRVTGVRSLSQEPLAFCDAAEGVARKEVVIENDIAWRVDTMVDFLFGKSITIGSLCENPTKQQQIEHLLRQILHQSGGEAFLQQLALLGAVYGFVDVLVKFDSSKLNDSDPSRDESDPRASRKGSGEVRGSSPSDGESAPSNSSSTDPGAGNLPPQDANLTRIARCIRLEVVEPARALPVLSDFDWTSVQAYVQVHRVPRRKDSPRKSRRVGFFKRLFSNHVMRDVNGIAQDDDHTIITELLTPHAWQRYEDETLVDHGRNSLGEIPLVHIQNIAVPFQYPGTSDVEQLVPLQDELNTRLSDRANRITMQAFKMYLAKGMDDVSELQIAPGRLITTESTSAEIIEFGGDTTSGSEDQHITELREAMDKVSGVTPIAAGAIRGRIGNLTSAAALRVTMMSLLAKTERKRTTYGQGLQRMCELALKWLDLAGLFSTTPDERKVEIRWQGLLPDSQMDRLREAQIKRGLGISAQTVLSELGYEPSPSIPSPGTPPIPSPGTPGEG